MKKAFNLPNNNLHSSHYLQLLIETGDKVAFSETFNALTKNNNINHWKNYLVGASKLFSPGDPIQMDRSLKATKIFSGNNEFMQLPADIYWIKKNKRRSRTLKFCSFILQ